MYNRCKLWSQSHFDPFTCFHSLCPICSCPKADLHITNAEQGFVGGTIPSLLARTRSPVDLLSSWISKRCWFWSMFCSREEAMREVGHGTMLVMEEHTQVLWKVLWGHERGLASFESIDERLLVTALAGNFTCSHELLISPHKNATGQVTTHFLIDFGLISFLSSLCACVSFHR